MSTPGSPPDPGGKPAGRGRGRAYSPSQPPGDRSSAPSTTCATSSSARSCSCWATGTTPRTWPRRRSSAAGGRGAGLPDVQNLRAWIFRVGLNAAKDVQRTRLAPPGQAAASGRRSMLADRAAARPALEDQEDLHRLRRAIMNLRHGGEGSLPPAAKRRADLRADRRDAPAARSAPSRRRCAARKLRKVRIDQLADALEFLAECRRCRCRRGE